MHTKTAEFQYVTGQMRESFGDLLASFEARNAQAMAMPGWELDLTYGTHAREVMDMRACDAKALGTVVYFHAGYWQSRDKAQFRFLAPVFNDMGWDMALINYPLCPEVSVAGIVASVERALQKVASHQSERGRAGPIVLCGHSAGAHLAIELALQHAAATAPLPIVGVLAISGVYNLQPLLETTLNTRLKFDANSAQACSPIHRVRPGAVPALFLCGDTETPAFHGQSQEMARLWQLQGNVAQCSAVAHADHFSVLEHISAPDGLVAQTLQSWAGD